MQKQSQKEFSLFGVSGLEQVQIRVPLVANDLQVHRAHKLGTLPANKIDQTQQRTPEHLAAREATNRNDHRFAGTPRSFTVARPGSLAVRWTSTSASFLKCSVQTQRLPFVNGNKCSPGNADAEGRSLCTADNALKA